MIDLETNKRWTSKTPKINLSFYYEKRRNGADMQYRVKVKVSAVTGSSYFGYPIYLDVKYESSLKVSEKTLKSASPYQWKDDIEWTSNWYTVSSKTSGTTKVTFRVYSSSAGERDVNYVYYMDVDPAASLLLVGDGELGDTFDLTVTKYDSTFTHTIVGNCNGEDVIICTQIAETTVPFTLPMRWMKGNYPGKTLSVTYTITTYSDTTIVGTNTVIGDAIVPDCMPYVYDGSSWIPVLVYIYNEGWQSAKSGVYDGIWKI